MDDGDRFHETVRLIGCLFLSMLATLERDGLLAPDSEVGNLGIVMALFIKWINAGRSDFDLGSEPHSERLGPAKDRKKWRPDFFDDYIVAYADKYHVAIRGPKGIKELVEDRDGDANLPVMPKSGVADPDPFGFGRMLKRYKSDHGPSGKIGGDDLDITTWSSAERKSHSFTKKDPLDKKMINMIKEGLVMQLG